MKHKIIGLALGLITLPFSRGGLAAGPYDGIWAVQLNGQTIMFTTLHEHDDQRVVFATLDGRGSAWDAFLGKRNGDTINAKQIKVTPDDTTSIEIAINITSPTTLEAEIVSCVPENECELPAGTQLTGRKVW
ncbi:MAG: hypothetical protein AXA67_10435 [Methylothermaceae bacteria B42]|nr:MAG: hypothetical protein AXA67_10435 [Methylothermaceae bacteria B42]HHJ40514.1 hypothetical protein [Methylothermaceae bacterium]